MVGEREHNRLSGGRLCLAAAPLIGGGEQNLFELVGVGRSFWGEYTSLARAKVPYLHEETVQVLAGHDLTRQREF